MAGELAAGYYQAKYGSTLLVPCADFGWDGSSFFIVASTGLFWICAEQR